MRKVFIVLGLFIVVSSYGQLNLDFGIKAGLNYGANGDVVTSAETVYQSPDANLGYHIGVFARLGDKFYFRPELVYTNTKSGYGDLFLKIQKLDAPLLLGVKIVGPLSVFGGPSLQYITNTDLESINVDNLENDFTVGLNFGAAVKISKFSFDIRYERGLSENEASFIADNITNLEGKIDTRPDQFIISVGFSFL
jgi:hypothetical protein